MDNPVTEIRDVVRSITEPYEATVIAANIEKYFTPDAFLEYPFFNQKKSPNGRDDLIGLYKLLRVVSIDNKIDFHAVMFNEDKTQGTIELTEHLNHRYLPVKRRSAVRFVVRIDLVRGEDGKYRICRQEDIIPNDLTKSGWVRHMPLIETLSDTIKLALGIFWARMGRLFLARGWFGP